METNRELDVYVKTVLTFGDKPAPAIAQIALQKTAKEGEKRHPEAAEVLKNNTYMDDICDSVHSVEKARKLSEDIDEVLNNGGFAVKGWLSNRPLKGNNMNENQKIETEMKHLQSPGLEKVLGSVWNHVENVFGFKVNPPNLTTLTRRIILSQIARILRSLGSSCSFPNSGKNRYAETVVEGPTVG